MADLGLWEIQTHERGPSLRTLNEVLQDFDIIELNPEFAVVTKKLAHPLSPTSTSPKVREIGASGTRWRQVLGGAEYNAELRGLNGLLTYDRMRRSDATVSQALRVAKTPVLTAEWWVDSADPTSDEANMHAEFIEKALFHWQSISWTQFLTEAMLMLDFGYSVFEKVFTFHKWRQRDRVVWRKFAPRAVQDVQEWDFDAHGGPVQVRMTGYEGESDVIIPIEKLLVFSYRMESGNIEGIPLLREMYKHWYYKENLYKIDAIQKERHGIGIPVIKLPPNFTTADKALADELGRNLRTNEWAHIVLPPMWEVEFAEVRGQQVDVLQSITHHDDKLMDAVLASFSREAEKSDAEVQLDVFLKASRYLADLLREVLNKYAIPELITYNWANVSEFPQLRVRHIGQVADLRTMSFTIRNLIGAQAIIPDEKLEDYLRYVNDLPRRDPDTEREVMAPQMPGEAGPPRQSQAGNQKIMPGTGEGEDDSGG